MVFRHIMDLSFNFFLFHHLKLHYWVVNFMIFFQFFFMGSYPKLRVSQVNLENFFYICFYFTSVFSYRLLFLNLFIFILILYHGSQDNWVNPGWLRVFFYVSFFIFFLILLFDIILLGLELCDFSPFCFCKVDLDRDLVKLTRVYLIFLLI